MSSSAKKGDDNSVAPCCMAGCLKLINRAALLTESPSAMPYTMTFQTACNQEIRVIIGLLLLLLTMSLAVGCCRAALHATSAFFDELKHSDKSIHRHHVKRYHCLQRLQRRSKSYRSRYEFLSRKTNRRVKDSTSNIHS